MRKILVAMFVVAASGCASVEQAKQSASQLSASLYAPKHYMDEDFLARIKKIDRGVPIDSYGRAFVSDYLTQINHNYAVYVTNLTSGKASVNIAYDSLNLGLTGASAIAAPVATKTGLAALSTFFQGQKQSIDKNIFDDKAVFALNSIMELRRTEVLEKIRRSLLNSTYTLGDALLDIDEFYRAGSLQSALQAAFLNQQRLEPVTTPAAVARAPAIQPPFVPQPPVPQPKSKLGYPSSTSPL